MKWQDLHVCNGITPMEHPGPRDEVVRCVDLAGGDLMVAVRRGETVALAVVSEPDDGGERYLRSVVWVHHWEELAYARQILDSL